MAGDDYVYEFQAIRWFHDYAIVPGLANVHGRFGFNNAHHLYAAMFSVGPWEGAVTSWSTDCSSTSCSRSPGPVFADLLTGRLSERAAFPAVFSSRPCIARHLPGAELMSRLFRRLLKADVASGALLAGAACLWVELSDRTTSEKQANRAGDRRRAVSCHGVRDQGQFRSFVAVMLAAVFLWMAGRSWAASGAPGRRRRHRARGRDDDPRDHAQRISPLSVDRDGGGCRLARPRRASGHRADLDHHSCSVAECLRNDGPAGELTGRTGGARHSLRIGAASRCRPRSSLGLAPVVFFKRRRDILKVTLSGWLMLWTATAVALAVWLFYAPSGRFASACLLDRRGGGRGQHGFPRAAGRHRGVAAGGAGCCVDAGGDEPPVSAIGSDWFRLGDHAGGDMVCRADRDVEA